MRAHYKQPMYPDPPPAYTPYPTHENQLAVTVNSGYPNTNQYQNVASQLQATGNVVSPPTPSKKHFINLIH